MAQGVVYILSLPAFNWQKQNYTPEFGRYSHSCNVIGERQMVVVGGSVASTSSQLNQVPPDPWEQGLGIFDLTALEWSAGYNASAAAYITSDPVKSYYQQYGRFPSAWADADVQGWFVKSGKPGTHLHSVVESATQSKRLMLTGVVLEQNRMPLHIRPLPPRMQVSLETRLTQATPIVVQSQAVRSRE